VSGLESDEAAVRASERDDFGPAVDRCWPRHRREGHALVPAVPVLVATERAVLPRAAAPEEIEEVLPPIRHSPQASRPGAWSSLTAAAYAVPVEVLALQVELCLPKSLVSRATRVDVIWASAGVLARRASGTILLPWGVKGVKTPVAETTTRWMQTICHDSQASNGRALSLLPSSNRRWRQRD
jgi:hypothetical protein